MYFGAGNRNGEALWDPGPSSELGSFPSPQGHSQAVRCLRFSPDGKWLASAADDHTVKVTPDVGMQAVPRGYPEHTQMVSLLTGFM